MPVKTFTDEHKRKISESQKGSHNSFYGHKHSEATRKKLRAKRKGKRPSWKGGRVKSGGYIMLFKPNHPSANKKGYIPEHRFLIGEVLGHPLEKQNEVHHINNIRDDNRFSNLIAFITRGKHKALHQWNYINPKDIIFDGRSYT